MNNKVPKVSVIVPAYNAEKYLERCLNSIAVQTMPDFECIIVDDGSADKTGEIADTFAKKDSRFKVIHKSNGGVAVARQTGIDAAIGIYTIQFDADDWVEAKMLEILLNEAEAQEADMVFCDCYRRDNFADKEILLSQRPISLEPKIVLGQMMHDLVATLWNKLIRRECYDIYDIQFVPEMLCEDQYICFCLLSHPIKIAYVPVALYHYDLTQNPQSLVNSGISPAARLKPLEFVSTTIGLTGIQEYFDNAILIIAYEALFPPMDKCSGYSRLFRKHLLSICHGKGFHLRIKIFVILRIIGIRIPLHSIKGFLWKYRNKKRKK